MDALTEAVSVDESLGERVRRLRVERGLSQSGLAGARFTKEYVSQIERGKTRPTAHTIEWLAERLGVDREFLETGVAQRERLRVESVVAQAEAAIEAKRYEDGLELLTGIDPKTNKAVSLYSAVQGNPNLTPEIATTVSAGVVMTPTFIPGFSASLDWYSIVVKAAVFSPSRPQITQQCALGVQIYCNELHYDDPAHPDTAHPGDYPGARPVRIVHAAFLFPQYGHRSENE